MMTGTSFISKISPMKRILCMCPVPKVGKGDTDHFDIGFAVSDPYLAYAIPVTPDNGHEPFELHFSRLRIGDTQVPQLPQITWTSLPKTPDALMKSIGYTDLGGVVLALPMKTKWFDEFRHSFDVAHLSSVRNFMSQIVRNYQGDDDKRPFNLLCYVQEQVTLEEAKEMARTEPEIWEEVEFESRNTSSMNACVALNAFLYQHNGGGWPNTFG